MAVGRDGVADDRGTPAVGARGAACARRRSRSLPCATQHSAHEPVRVEALRPDSAGSIRSAFGLGSHRTYRSSSSSSSASTTSYSSRDSATDALPLDLQRFAKVCGDLEALQQRLTKKEVKNRELRAKNRQLTRQVDQIEREQRERERRVQTLLIQLEGEQVAKQEAVDRVAHAMIQSDELEIRLQEATQMADALRSELGIRSNLSRELERRQSKTLDETIESRETIARLEGDLRVAHRELEIQSKNLLMERERNAQHVCKSDTEAEMRARIVEMEGVLEIQTLQLARQQDAIVDLHRACTEMESRCEDERISSQQHAAHQMQANVALQELLKENAIQIRSLNASLAESEERALMQLEETDAYAAWRRMALKRESQREEVYSVVESSREKLEKAFRHVDAARRKAVGELVDTKKQLELLHGAMRGIDEELQRMNKTFVVFRAREANVSKALREYGRRNRVLEDAVELMSSKLRHLSESLRRSEQRKQQAVVESHQLKRGLVIERCQREDLLQQCVDLETCLASFQRAAFQSAGRALSVEKENSVLQHAVTQLCAYASELADSQRALQDELKQLEVHGRVESHVFG